MGGMAWVRAVGRRSEAGPHPGFARRTACSRCRPVHRQAERSQDLIDRYVNTKAEQDKQTNAKVGC